VWCADLLDRIDALGPRTAAAEDQLTRAHNALAEVLAGADVPTALSEETPTIITSAAYVDADGAEVLASVFRRRFPSVDKP